MSYLEDLYKRILGGAGRVVSTVGPALGNPLPEFGWSEQAQAKGAEPLSTEQRIQKSMANTGGIAEGDYASATKLDPSIIYPSRTQNSGGTGILTPQQGSVNAKAVNDYLKSQGITSLDTLNPVQKKEYDRLNTPQPTPGGSGNGGIDFNALLEQQRALARSAYDEGMRRAGAAFDRARGIYDEGVGLLAKKRDTFKTQFDEGAGKILDRYETERGNLQAGAQGAQTRSLNALRALGLGGSAILRSGGRQAQDNAKAFGGLQTQRNENDNANTGLYNDRLDWASGQEGSLRRSLEAAQEARTAAENQAGLIYGGDVAGINNNFASILSNIQQNADALNAARTGVAGYTANPYSVNIPDLTKAITAELPAVGNTAGGGEQGVNVNGFNDILAMLDPRKRAGVAGAGLFA